jgi:hypothetical protein
VPVLFRSRLARRLAVLIDGEAPYAVARLSSELRTLLAEIETYNGDELNVDELLAEVRQFA